MEEGLPHRASPLGVQDIPYGRAIEKPFMYFYIGLYAQHLQTWLKFFSLENFLILKSEDFFSRTAETYADVLRFLELPDWKPAEFRNYSYWGNRKAAGKSENPIDPAFGETLSEWYKPWNEQLYRLLGRDFQWK